MKLVTRALALVAALFSTITAVAQKSADGAWTLLAKSAVVSATSAAGAAPVPEPWITPEKAQHARLAPEILLANLATVPGEFDKAALTGNELQLPNPDGGFSRFRVAESSIMEPALAAEFPEIKTYVGQGIDDPAATVRADWTPQGFHASVLTPDGFWYIDPAFKNDNTNYVSYYKRDLANKHNWICGGPLKRPVDETRELAAKSVKAISIGAQLRTYRLACAATREYTLFHGGTIALGQAAIVTMVNRVNQVYEADFAMRLVLVANNSSLVYVNHPDPYNNTNPTQLLSQNQSNVDSVIGNANYDIGHVVGTGGGGLAYLGVVCEAGFKAGGETGSPSPTGDGFYIDYVAHEMGHQFNGNHTFNGVTANCSGGNRNGTTAMEPGSGSSIMAYAGICGADDLQAVSDPYFHSISHDEIITYITSGQGSTCGVATATGNIPPVVSAGANYAIPINTPFTLTATGSDANGDTLTYCWEQRDLGAAQLVSNADNGASPIFRTYNPTTSPSRTFPRLSNIIANTLPIGEKYPAVARAAMKFRVTARDNRAGGGGVTSSDMQLQVVGTAGPFAVSAPNTAVTWSGDQTVTWSVANTTAAPINTALVNIRLSTDGGQTFPTLLLANTPNDGSQLVSLPDINSNTARIKVEAVGNVYWDMSNANFTITKTTPVTISGYSIE